MAFLWSFTDIATLLSAVGVGGKDESESVPPEPGDKLEDGEFLLRLPVSSLIWKENDISDPSNRPTLSATDPPCLAGGHMNRGWREQLMQNWFSECRETFSDGCGRGQAVLAMACPFPVACGARNYTIQGRTIFSWSLCSSSQHFVPGLPDSTPPPLSSHCPSLPDCTGLFQAPLPLLILPLLPPCPFPP